MCVTLHNVSYLFIFINIEVIHGCHTTLTNRVTLSKKSCLDNVNVQELGD